MSYQASLYKQCEDLQARIPQVWANSAEFQADRSPFLEYILSPANENGINQSINPGGGKTRTINVLYNRPILESTVSEQTGRDCRAYDGIGDFSKTYEIDTEAVLESGESIKVSDLAQKCENNSDFVARTLLRHMVAVDKAVATKTATEAAALMGNYSADVIAAYSLDDDDNLVVETLLADGNYKAGALEKIQWAAEASNFASLVGFGGRLMYEHVRLAMAGCCTQWGINVNDLMNEFGFAYGYDRRVATALGSVQTKNLIMEPQALQLLRYTENDALGGLETLNLATGNFYGTGVTPAGVPVDITIKDDCKLFTIQVQASTKLVGKPSDMFATGDNFFGVTGVSEVTTTNPS
ncbi:MAG: hypothetical protein LC664_12900 [Flavobacteriales bacterium]|nr:hypothetical protein [Flavobacteriales bacterium]